jgi:hypothetical protein
MLIAPTHVCVQCGERGTPKITPSSIPRTVYLECTVCGRPRLVLQSMLQHVPDEAPPIEGEPLEQDGL